MRAGDIEYELTRKRIKNMYLRVKPDGRVVVSAPLHASSMRIDAFVRSRAQWIRARQRSLAEQPAKRETAGVDGETISVWGRPYVLRIEEAARFDMRLEEGQPGIARFCVRRGSTAEQRQAWLKEWYRGELKREAARLVPKWERTTGLYCSEWRTKWMTSRWGTCNTKERRIWLNVALAKYPPECLEYVILHELAHIRERSHGPAFKAILDAYMPNWRAVRKLLG